MKNGKVQNTFQIEKEKSRELSHLAIELGVSKGQLFRLVLDDLLKSGDKIKALGEKIAAGGRG